MTWMKATGRTVELAILLVGLGGYFGTSAETALAEEWGPQPMKLAQAAPSPLAGGGYDPMAPPFNPMMPGPGAGSGTRSEPDVELDPDLGNLPDTPGIEDTFYLCSACHSVSLIRQQRISDARWDYLWNWMIEKQGMPEQDPRTKERILSYLKRHFSSER